MFQYDNFARDAFILNSILTRTSKSFTDENGGFFPDTEAHGLLKTLCSLIRTPNPTLLPETWYAANKRTRSTARDYLQMYLSYNITFR
jgi:hypothetical protein